MVKDDGKLRPYILNPILKSSTELYPLALNWLTPKALNID